MRFRCAAPVAACAVGAVIDSRRRVCCGSCDRPWAPGVLWELCEQHRAGPDAPNESGAVGVGCEE